MLRPSFQKNSRDYCYCILGIRVDLSLIPVVHRNKMVLNQTRSQLIYKSKYKGKPMYYMQKQISLHGVAQTLHAWFIVINHLSAEDQFESHYKWCEL